MALAGLVMGGASWTPQASPGLLQQVGSWPGYGRGPAADVSVVGHHAYVAIDEGGLLILDIADPANPRRVGEYRAPGRTLQVQVVGSRAYLGTSVHRGGGCETEGWRGHLLVLDVSNPARPALLGGFATATAIQNVHMDGRLAFLGCDNGNGHEFSVSIVDVSNPNRPVELSVDHTMSREAVWTAGSQAYLGGMWASLRILDVSQPESPTENTEVDADIARNITGIQTSGDLYFLVQRPDDQAIPGRLLVCQARAGEPPRLLATLVLSDAPLGIRLFGHYACLAMGAAGLVFVDLTDPTQPKMVGSVDTPGVALQAEVSGDFVEARSQIEILDVTDPTRPTRIGLREFSAYIESMDVIADVTYLGTTRGRDVGLEIVDFGDPGNPVWLSETPPTSMEPWWNPPVVTVSGRYAYVTTDQLGPRRPQPPTSNLGLFIQNGL